MPNDLVRADIINAKTVIIVGERFVVIIERRNYFIPLPCRNRISAKEADEQTILRFWAVHDHAPLVHVFVQVCGFILHRFVVKLNECIFL